MPSQNSTRVVLLAALAWAAGLFVVSFGLRLVINALNIASNYRLDPFFGGFFYTLLIGPAAGGALAGYYTARLLKRYAGLASMRVLPVALVWAFAMLLGAVLPFYFSGLFLPPPADPVPLAQGIEPEPVWTPPFLLFFARDFLFWILPGVLGGLQLARELRRDGLKLNNQRMAVITAGWGAAFGLGGGAGSTLVNLLSWYWISLRDPGWLANELVGWLKFGVTGLIAGAFGAWLTVSVIRSVMGMRSLPGK